MLLLILFYLIGIICITISIYLRYWRGKRKFNRRNLAGLETFNSYKDSLLTIYLENFARFLSILLMVVGIFILLSAFFEWRDIIRVNHW